jgi:hypothetical protein
MVWSMNGFAQIDKLNRAQELLQVAKKPDLARFAIDSVILHPETKNDYISWTTRAYIYYEIYKRTDLKKTNSALRDTIISSLKKSNTLKPDAEGKLNNNKLFLAIAKNYKNLAIVLLRDSLNEKASKNAYNKSKEISLIFKPDSNFTQSDEVYYNGVGSIFADIFNNDNSNVKAGEIAKVALLKVLEKEPNNAGANMNLGLMYYNQAANLVKSVDYGADISQIEIIQESVVKLAKQAEPLINKVHVQNNKNPKAAEALYLIYRMLSDNAKMELFKNKCKALGIKVD